MPIRTKTLRAPARPDERFNTKTRFPKRDPAPDAAQPVYDLRHLVAEVHDGACLPRVALRREPLLDNGLDAGCVHSARITAPLATSVRHFRVTAFKPKPPASCCAQAPRRPELRVARGVSPSPRPSS